MSCVGDGKREEEKRQNEVGRSELAKSRVRQQQYYTISLAFISGPFSDGEC